MCARTQQHLPHVTVVHFCRNSMPLTAKCCTHSKSIDWSEFSRTFSTNRLHRAFKKLPSTFKNRS